MGRQASSATANDSKRTIIERLGSIVSALQKPAAAMAPTSLLLKNGTVIVHEANYHAKAIKADVLVQGNKIAKIEPNITASPDVECIDCTDKIVAPGFVDTHRHMYTIGLRGRHGDHLLTDYIVHGKTWEKQHRIAWYADENAWTTRYTAKLQLRAHRHLLGSIGRMHGSHSRRNHHCRRPLSSELL